MLTDRNALCDVPCFSLCIIMLSRTILLLFLCSLLIFWVFFINKSHFKLNCLEFYEKYEQVVSIK